VNHMIRMCDIEHCNESGGELKSLENIMMKFPIKYELTEGIFNADDRNHTDKVEIRRVNTRMVLRACKLR
ncbi:24169_t:CDS:2, partial [Gigaspora margarita]